MGIINNDLFELSNGVQKVGTYISFNNETLYLRKNSTNMGYPYPQNNSNSSNGYVLNANYRIFWDKAAKNAGKTFMESRFISIVMLENELTGNLYEKLYNKLKESFSNFVDDLVDDLPVNESQLSGSTGPSGPSGPSGPYLSSTGPSGPSSDSSLSSTGPSGPSSDSSLSSTGPSGPSL